MAVTKTPLAALSSLLPERIDIFLASVSYEERCLKVPSVMSENQADSVIFYGDLGVCGERGAQNKAELLNRFSARARFVDLNLDEPVSTADSIQESLSRFGAEKPTTFVIDITTFTHETLLILLRILQNRAMISDTTVIAVYNLAAEYSADSPIKDKWLTKGVKEVRSVLGYPGTNQPTRKVHLIVLAGLETERAAKLIELYEPNLLSVGWGEPDPSLQHVGVGTFHAFYRRLVEKYKGVSEFKFACLDPVFTKDAIERQVARSSAYNTIVAPLNTKVSTLGVALAAFENDSIQLCYAPVEQYNLDSYSRPSDDCLIFQIPMLASPTEPLLSAHSSF